MCRNKSANALLFLSIALIASCTTATSNISMTANDFMSWLGEQLDNLAQVPEANDHKLEASRELVQNAIQRLNGMSEEQRTQVVELIAASSQTRMLGSYRRPYDESGIDEWNEGILATLEGYLK